MIQVTFAHLVADAPSEGTGFYLDGLYAGYIGQDATGAAFVYFHRAFWLPTRLREARGYVPVADRSAALRLVSRLALRLAYRQLRSRARTTVNSPCASTFYQRVLADTDFQRTLARVLIDQRTWNDPSQGNGSRDLAFTPECASPEPVPAPRPTKRVFNVYPALTFNLLHYTDGSYRRVTAADIQAGADPRPANTAFPFAQVTGGSLPPSPAPGGTWALFIPPTVVPLVPGHRHAVPTTRNTQ
ncbi:hypothetical protein QO259_12295 [Salinicola sp. JS01]|uniref:hypothetical protein n=1 Tax=Salinicola sp. JS01 TaxID=3050071 RepID=UPI00255BEABE|nr:hypothetical protein [Salinicola sp. JS01]WIX31597.1 hypothetical protein QO259_12295 [Salinicola sp. JS01]